MNFIYRFLGDEEQAKDATQEVFLRAYTHGEKYKPTAKFSTWLYKIAINLCKDWMRKKKRASFVSLQATLKNSKGGMYTLDEVLPDSSPSPDAEIYQHELECLVKKAILSLPEEQRMVVIMRQYQNLPFAEIAAILDCPISTVKSRMYYALGHLRMILQDSGIDASRQ